MSKQPPRLPRDQVRSKLLGVMLTAEEHKAIDEFSASQGLYASSWARLVLVEAVKKGES